MVVEGAAAGCQAAPVRALYALWGLGGGPNQGAGVGVLRAFEKTFRCCPRTLFAIWGLCWRTWCRYDKQTQTHTLYAIDTRLIQYVPGGGARRSQHLAGTKATAGGGAVDQSVVVTRSSGPPGEKKRFVVIMSHNLGLMVFLRNMIYRLF